MISLTVPDIRAEDIQLAVDVLKSGMLVQGEQVQRFETALAEYIGVPNAVAVSSGTAALHLSLVALGIGPGDAVLVPAFSFVATANAVCLAGAVPVFVDVSANNYNMVPDLLEQTILEYSRDELLKAVMPVHEFGCPADMKSITAIASRYGLHVVEDAACALGARLNGRHVGTFGDCGCFSFHPRKSVTTGEGGIIVVEDDEVAGRLRLLRSHGVVRNELGRIDCVEMGYNYRMTDFQAALGINQLVRFEDSLCARRVLVDLYYDGLSGCRSLRLPKKTEDHSWQSLMLRLEEGGLLELIRSARTGGIQLGQGAQCIPRTAAYGYTQGFEVAHNCEQDGFVVPLYAGLKKSDVEQVVAYLQGWS